MAWALIFALLRAGSSSAARMAMMAITTSSPIGVNAWRVFSLDFISVSNYDSLLREPQPVELLSAGDGIRHSVLPIDDDRVRRNRIPNRRGKVSGGFQLKTTG